MALKTGRRKNASGSRWCVLCLCVASLLSLPFHSQAVDLGSPNEEFTGWFGWSVSGVPDVSGDGVGDVVLGAIGEGNGEGLSGAGRAYVFNGKTGQLIHSLVSPNDELTGNFGSSVAGMPDLDGDGKGEVVVGARGEDPSGSPSDAGRVYIFSGATGQWMRQLKSPSEEVTGSFGWSVSEVPDINGDGRWDLVVGAIGEGQGQYPSGAGRVHILSGFTGALLHTLVSPNDEVTGDFGYSVAGIPDLDGDGSGDVVVGARGEDPTGSPSEAGRAYIFSGKSGNLLRSLKSPNESSTGQFGISVSAVPDINGDGHWDVVVGAPGEEPGTSPKEAGRAYIFDGFSGNRLRTLVSPSEEFEGGFGTSVSGFPDLNGDGSGEVVVGAIGESPGSSPNDAGRTYIFNGANGSLLKTLSSPHEDFIGNFGWAVSEIAFEAGGGQLGAIASAIGESSKSGPKDVGRAYLFHFNAPPTPTPVYDVEPEPPDGFVDAKDLHHWFQAIKEGEEDSLLLFDFSRFWQGEWR